MLDGDNGHIRGNNLDHLLKHSRKRLNKYISRDFIFSKVKIIPKKIQILIVTAISNEILLDFGLSTATNIRWNIFKSYSNNMNNYK